MHAHAATFLIIGLAILVGLWIFSKVLKLILLVVLVVVLFVAFSIYGHPKTPVPSSTSTSTTATVPANHNTTVASRDLTQQIGDEAVRAAGSLSSHDLVLAVSTLVRAYNIIHPSVHLTATQHGADRLNITSSVGSACLTFSGRQVVTSPAPCRVS